MKYEQNASYCRQLPLCTKGPISRMYLELVCPINITSDGSDARRGSRTRPFPTVPSFLAIQYRECNSDGLVILLAIDVFVTWCLVYVMCVILYVPAWITGCWV